MARLPDRPSRVPKLIAGFPQYLQAFAASPPFTRYGQWEFHYETIGRRRALGSVIAAISDESFVRSLHRTLGAWGIGVRGSKLVDEEKFAVRLQEKKSDLAALDGLCIDDPQLPAAKIGERIWDVIESWNVVENNAKTVAGSKALHHILPELVVPMDRAWTQKFFRWQNHEFQYDQAACFSHAFTAFVRIARKTNPKQYVGAEWHTSRTKVIDNALIGLLLEEDPSKKPQRKRFDMDELLKKYGIEE